MQTPYPQLCQHFPDIQFKEQEPLAPYTTVKIGGPAEVFCEVKTSDDFSKIVIFARKNDIPVTILGWGANSLISDEGIQGLVIKNSAQEIKIVETRLIASVPQEQITVPRWQHDETEGTGKSNFTDLNFDESNFPRVHVQVDAGTPLPVLMNTLLQEGITGLQWYSRIPATLGGAIVNNIHGGTHFIEEIIESVEIIDQEGALKTLRNNELEFDYDFSRFHHSGEIIVKATIQLFKGDVEQAKKVIKEWAIRKATQPQNSLGCIFQNISKEQQLKLGYPTNSVGYIVEHILGMKGYQIGEAKVSEKHCAFIENVGSATAYDYLAVIKKIITETKAKTGIELKPEIFFLGFKQSELEGIK